MRFAVASYCVVVAVLMALWWGLDIRKGALTRGGIAVALKSDYT
jgi:hypothetical protein